MSGAPLEPLPPELADLFTREAKAYADDPALAARVLRRVEVAVALAPPPAPATTPSGLPLSTGGKIAATKLAAIAALSFGIGAVTGGAVVARSRSTPAVAPSATPSDPAPVETPGVAPAPNASAAPSAEPAGSASVGPSALPSHTSSPSPQPPAAGDLVRERELLDVARAAIARGRPDDAIAAAERHAQKWPRGRLTEEREVVWIQALAASGRRDQARAKAGQFKKSYPRSMLMPAVDAALKE